MSQQISDWSNYSELLQELAGLDLDWSTWSNLTASIVDANPGLWGAVPENAMYGKGVAELLGEIYEVNPTDVDLDDAAQMRTTDEDVLSLLWHVVSAQPATDLPGYDGWEGYLVCWEPDGSLTYATARDAAEWTPVPATDDATDLADSYEEGGGTEAPAGTVEAAAFATTKEAEKGATLVIGLVQEVLDQAMATLPEEVLAALGPPELESLAVEASKVVAAQS